jgi:tetratricopeptide (TPR) repeat protein
MNLPRVTRLAALTGILLLPVQPAQCAPSVSAEGVSVRDRAEHLRQQGRLPEAERLLAEFLASHSADAPGPLLAHIHNDLGVLWQDQHRLDEALRGYKRAVEAWEHAGPKYSIHAATSLNNLATVLWDDGRLSDAHKALVRSAAILVEVAGPSSPALLQLYYNQGVLSLALNRFDEAEEAYRKFLRITNPAIEDDYLLKLAVVNSDLGLICRLDGRTDEAGRHFAKSREVWKQWREQAPGLPGKRNLDPVLLLNIAATFGRAGATPQAAETLEVAIASIEPTGAAAQARLVRALQLQAKILRGMKRKTEARAAELRAKEIQLANGNTGNPTEARIDLAALQSAAIRRRDLRR